MLLHATDLHATYTVVAPLRLPHHTGSLLRGLLGRALRRTACPRDAGPCPAACERPGQCTYARLFDPAVPSPSPHRFLKAGAEAPPRLLPLLPSPQSAALDAGASLHLGYRVLGEIDDETEGKILSALEAIADLPIGTDAGRVTLAGVARQGRRNREITTTAPEVTEPGTLRARITFETPAWIEHDKRLVERLTFPVLFRALYRRLTVLSALYGRLDDDQEAQFARLDARASQVRCVESSLHPLRWERLSEERGERHGMRGLLGSATFEGDLGELLPVLTMGEAAHVGKSTGFGLGRMRVARDAG